jgi:hypothetical protein
MPLPLETRKTMTLTRYIYEKVTNVENGEINTSAKRPIGCIVFVDKENYGVSICNPNDQFAKKTGRTIATGRAKTNGNAHLTLPRGEVDTHQGIVPIAQYVQDRIALAQEHANKYFK